MIHFHWPVLTNCVRSYTTSKQIELESPGSKFQELSNGHILFEIVILLEQAIIPNVCIFSISIPFPLKMQSVQACQWWHLRIFFLLISKHQWISDNIIFLFFVKTNYLQSYSLILLISSDGWPCMSFWIFCQYNHE